MKTIKQIALELDLNPQTLYKYIREGKLKTVRLGTGPRARVRITEEQLNEFLNINQ